MLSECCARRVPYRRVNLVHCGRREIACTASHRCHRCITYPSFPLDSRMHGRWRDARSGGRARRGKERRGCVSGRHVDKQHYDAVLDRARPYQARKRITERHRLDWPRQGAGQQREFALPRGRRSKLVNEKLIATPYCVQHSLTQPRDCLQAGQNVIKGDE
ncbi:hypothetical protein OBBRIDRAFT_309677 [Obba rivulosa]|uniref:Uncharacterized protein n=1 Tax=Obba rivulosa TaxID=1052685 RepID=A0A8E2AUE5_9APHY|nr:hypothetical protein OBBRIDRAFT_309677 [Obba rivulosa]